MGPYFIFPKESYFIFLLGLPVIGGCLASVLRGRKSDWAAVAFSFFTLYFGLWLVQSWVLQKPNFEPLKYSLAKLPWISPKTNFIGFLMDPLGALMLLIIIIIGFLVMLFSADYIGPKNKEHPLHNGKGKYYFWMSFFVCSMIGVATAPNFFQLFIFWEITTLCSWALISYYESERALLSGYKALIMTHIGGLFLMTAIVILFVQTGSFEFSALNELALPLRGTVFLLMLVGAWAKAAQIPFYTWLPDAMEAPTPVSCYLHAAAMVKAGVYLAARVVSSCSDLSDGVGFVTAIMALLTMSFAVFLFFFQDDLKRLLALSTISHLAYILLACSLAVLGPGTLRGFQGGLLHIAAHAAGKGLLFLSVGALTYFTGTKRISELSGAAHKLPFVAFAFLVGAFTVTGVPPLAGFWSKFFILTGALELGGLGTVFAVLLLLESMVAFGYFLWVAHKVFFGAPSKAVEEVTSHSAPIEISLLIFIFLCFAIPFIMMPFIQNVGVLMVK